MRARYRLSGMVGDEIQALDGRWAATHRYTCRSWLIRWHPRSRSRNWLIEVAAPDLQGLKTGFVKLLTSMVVLTGCSSVGEDSIACSVGSEMDMGLGSCTGRVCSNDPRSRRAGTRATPRSSLAISAAARRVEGRPFVATGPLQVRLGWCRGADDDRARQTRLPGWFYEGTPQRVPKTPAVPAEDGVWSELIDPWSVAGAVDISHCVDSTGLQDAAAA